MTNIYKFIKDYDFKGLLMEFYTSNPELYDCTVKLVLLLNVEAKMLYIFFDCIRIRKNEWYTYFRQILSKIIGRMEGKEEVRIYDNGRFIINVMNPGGSVTRFTTFKRFHLIFGVY